MKKIKGFRMFISIRLTNLAPIKEKTKELKAVINNNFELNFIRFAN
jgi:hypothetical protein